MVMPEAPVNEYRRVPSPQDNIRPSGKLFFVQSVTKTRVPKECSDAELWNSVLSSDS